MFPTRLARKLRTRAKRIVLGTPEPTAVERGWMTMGRHSYGVRRVHYDHDDHQVVRVGKFTSIAHDVEFLPGGNHHTDRVTTFPLRRVFGLPQPDLDLAPSKGDVVVGNDVWIGRGAKIVGGVTIGHGAVVAAYSVVAKHVEPYTLVAGAPAVVKRRRFPDRVCEALLAIAWWDWPDDVIVGRVDDLTSPDIEGFISKYG